MNLLQNIIAHLEIEIKPTKGRKFIPLDERVRKIVWSTGDDGHQFHLNRYDIPVPSEDLDEIVYENDYITLVSNEGTIMTFEEDGFRLIDLLNCVLEFEKVNRPKMMFLGEVDVHHIHFEGLNYTGDPHTFTIEWDM
jgi:hypothetical protein